MFGACRTGTGGDIEAAARAAEVTVTRRYSMNRQSGAPLEGRAIPGYRDHRLDEIVIYASTQSLHMVRVATDENLGIDEHQLGQEVRCRPIAGGDLLELD